MLRNRLIIFLLFSAQLVAGQTTLEWAKQIGGTGNETVSKMTVDQNGNSYITGDFTGIVDFDPSEKTHNIQSIGSRDLFIAKYDSLGKFQWVYQIVSIDHGSKYFKNNITGVVVDKNGSAFFTGNFLGVVDFNLLNGGYVVDAKTKYWFVLKLTGQGEFLWVENIETGSNIIDNLYENVASSLTIDHSGNIYLAGAFKNFKQKIDFDPDNGIAHLTSPEGKGGYILKLNNDGNFVWVKGLFATYSCVVKCIKIDNEDNIVAAGIFGSDVDFDPDTGIYKMFPGNGTGTFILKLDNDGRFEWANNVRSSTTIYNHMAENDIFDMELDQQGNMVATGWFDHTAKFGSIELNSGGYYSSPDADATYSSYRAIYVFKMHKTGYFKWAYDFGPIDKNCEIGAKGITTDFQSNIYISGIASGACDFKPGNGIQQLYEYNYGDGYLLKLDSNGQYLGTVRLACNGRVRHLSPDALCLSCTFSGERDFNPGTESYLFRTKGENDIAIFKLSGRELATFNYLGPYMFKPFPNPTSGKLNLDFDSRVDFIEVKLFDISGRMVRHERFFTTYSIHMNIEVASGIYIMEVTLNSSLKEVYKVVKN